MSNERHETVADNVSAKHQFREVAKMISHEEVAVSKMETTTPTSEKSSAVGNAAAMRDALEEVRFYLPHFLQYMRLHREDEEAGGYYGRILDVVNAALSAPPRNCDIGTAEEQSDRFDKFCESQDCERYCPLFKDENCELAWAQMPYEAGGVTERGKTYRMLEWGTAHAAFEHWLDTGMTINSENHPTDAEPCLFAGTGFSESDGAEGEQE